MAFLYERNDRLLKFAYLVISILLLVLRHEFREHETMVCNSVASP